MEIGDMFQGILITKILDNGNTIIGIYMETGKLRTIYYDKKYGGWRLK